MKTITTTIQTFNDEYITKTQYNLMVKVGKGFIKEMDGDGMFHQHKMNQIQLEAMLLGWLYAQQFFLDRKEALQADYVHENCYLVAQDLVMQAACDAADKNPQFGYHFQY